MIVCGPEWDRRVVNLDPTSNVGIIMSGGIDSWVLYNLLTNYTNPKIFNIVRSDGFDTPDRVEALVKKPIIRIPEVSTHHDDRIWMTVESILECYDIDYLYGGINHGPPTEYFPEFDTPDRPYRAWKIDTPRRKVPFLHLYKYHIIDLALTRNIDLSGTMSCIRSIISPCGECWQCREKMWGYEQLGVYNP